MVEIEVKSNILNASLGTELKVNNLNQNIHYGVEVKRDIEKIEVKKCQSK